MRLDGRRESTNVDDRRGKKVGAGIGIGGLIIAGVIFLLTGKIPTNLIQNMNVSSSTETAYTPTAEEEELASFAKKILAGTEDVWTAEFKKMGRTYDPPKLVLFTDAVQSGCGNATSSSGPFYCSADQTVYIDLSFFSSMKQQFGTAGDFAYAYVIAHEVGHHVQYLLGTLSAAHQKMQQVSKTESNQISVRLELQADFYAGVWANRDNAMFNSLEEGDIDEGLAIAARIGDDYLQKRAQGYTVPESFNHGTSAQRSKWLKKGITTGDVKQGDTFSPAYSQL
ncbi:MAG: neutral zinc metallopeptidase [Bacteroidales bacterium]|jgi:predicted metalloprotease|nr:neutral zinc metallopeptidase [Bacteroidales bacterium]